MPFLQRELVALTQHGIAAADAEQQLQLLQRGELHTAVVRPCTVGDGIIKFSNEASIRYQKAFQAHCSTPSQLIQFVPASGAATRMFAFLHEQGATTAPHKQFREGIFNFAFSTALDAALQRGGSSLREAVAQKNWRLITDVLLSKEGLGYHDAPKGSIPFHHYQDQPRTPFMEHCHEAAAFAQLGAKPTVHFTVPHTFSAEARRAVEAYAQSLHASIKVGFSEQAATTDTLALTNEGELLYADGKPALRPGGHGALIENLNAQRAPVVFIRNIDNVLPDHLKAETLQIRAMLAGFLLELVDQRNQAILRLDESVNEGLALASKWAHTYFIEGGAPLPFANAKSAHAWLNRPIRVCGMVANTGQPGGGPFWVDTPRFGRSVQIVELAQFDVRNEYQQAQMAASTHFNPVDLVCAPIDPYGMAYDLKAFVNDDRAFISTKQVNRKPVRVLERPGLWNGAMENWLSVFVEIPSSCFAPVKSVVDLLRPEHQTR